MPGTVKSGLLSDADKSYKCDSQEKVCWILNLPLDKGHFITEYLFHRKTKVMFFRVAMSFASAS